MASLRCVLTLFDGVWAATGDVLVRSCFAAFRTAARARHVARSTSHAEELLERVREGAHTESARSPGIGQEGGTRCESAC